MIRTLLLSRAPAFRVASVKASVPHRGYASEKWEERGKSLEDQSVRKHDQELLKKLAEAEAAQAAAEARAKVIFLLFVSFALYL